MKKTIFLILFIVLFALTSCAAERQPLPEIFSDDSPIINEAVIEEKESPMEETIAEEVHTEEIEPLQKETPNETYPFVMPDFSHEYADEMLAVLQGFSHEFIFPEFENLKKLDWVSRSVSSNLYQLTLFLNNEFVSEGGVGCLEDMNTVGRRYFGDDFSFPKNLVCEEIVPVEANPNYYTWTIARGGMVPPNYLLTDVQEGSEYLVATFLPYTLHLSWDFESGVSDVYGILFFKPNYGSDNIHYWEYHAELMQPQIASDEKITSDYLEYCLLPVPQEQLGTITVTFRRENDGRLIAASCRYNREASLD